MQLWKRKGGRFEVVRSIPFSLPQGRSLSSTLEEIRKDAKGELCFLVFTPTEERDLNRFIKKWISSFACYTHSTGTMDFLNDVILNTRKGLQGNVFAKYIFSGDSNKSIGHGKTCLAFWINHRPH